MIQLGNVKIFKQIYLYYVMSLIFPLPTAVIDAFEAEEAEGSHRIAK